MQSLFQVLPGILLELVDRPQKSQPATRGFCVCKHGFNGPLLLVVSETVSFAEPSPDTAPTSDV